MKAKTSITLSRETLRRIDRSAGPKRSRSSFIEGVLSRYFQETARAEMEARDLEHLNRAAERLNAEAADALEYQATGE
jgi:hypothetical protein